MRKTVGYFGSVRFFKNMILLAVIVMIAVPTGFAIHLNTRLRNTEQLLAQQAVPVGSPDAAQGSEADLPQTAGEPQDADTFEVESPYADR